MKTSHIAVHSSLNDCYHDVIRDRELVLLISSFILERGIWRNIVHFQIYTGILWRYGWFTCHFCGILDKLFCVCFGILTQICPISVVLLHFLASASLLVSSYLPIQLFNRSRSDIATGRDHLRSSHKNTFCSFRKERPSFNITPIPSQKTPKKWRFLSTLVLAQFAAYEDEVFTKRKLLMHWEKSPYG